VKKFEEAWGVKLSREPGMKLTAMFPAAIEGEIKAMYIMGENPMITDPDVHHVREALSKLDFFVFQDIFFNETAPYAHVILPACSYAEKDGTFTNTERRVQRVRKAIEPIGDSRDDCWIVSEIARRMGAKGFDYSGAEKIMEEIARLTPTYAGINYRRLDEGSLQWPCPSDEHPGTCIMHEEIFARPSGKGNFVAVKYRPPVQLTDAEYPLVLMTGRRLYHYHATMTRKVDVLNMLLSEEELKISPADAASLGVRPGDMVRVTSRQGEVKVRAKVTDAVPEGVVHMAFHFAETPTNELISSRPETLDPVTGTPAYKTCPVRVIRYEPVSGPERMVSALYRASQDRAFADSLFRDADLALKEYGLNDAEKTAIASGDVKKIEALTGQLDERVRTWFAVRQAQGKTGK
jgi:predicted molibdopterin-dependent oxidoreductase YjgC